MINGRFDLQSDTTDFMDVVRSAMEEAATKIIESAPDYCDIGRVIAGVDTLQQAKNIFCDAAILGNEKQNRTKRPRPMESSS